MSDSLQPHGLYSPPGPSVLGTSQARTLEEVAISSSRGSSRGRDRTHISCIAGRFFPEPPGKPQEPRGGWSNSDNSTKERHLTGADYRSEFSVQIDFFFKWRNLVARKILTAEEWYSFSSFTCWKGKCVREDYLEESRHIFQSHNEHFCRRLRTSD